MVYFLHRFAFLAVNSNGPSAIGGIVGIVLSLQYHFFPSDIIAIPLLNMRCLWKTLAPIYLCLFDSLKRNLSFIKEKVSIYLSSSL